MSEDAILWKLGFGAMVLAVSLLSLLSRTPREAVLDPVAVAPRMVQAADPSHQPVPATASLGPQESLVDATEPAPRREPPPLPATAVAARPQTQAPVSVRASLKHRPPGPAAAGAVRAAHGAIVRTTARPRPARARAPYASRRPHYSLRSAPPLRRRARAQLNSSPASTGTSASSCKAGCTTARSAACSNSGCPTLWGKPTSRCWC